MGDIKDGVNCRHIGAHVGQRKFRGDLLPISKCARFDQDVVLTWCHRCKFREPAVTSPEKVIQTSQTDEPAFMSRDGKRIAIENVFYGAHLFVVLSGPSAAEMDLSVLDQRGICVMGVNNSPAIFRPNIWVHGDPPNKFHHAIWKDPAIMKFVPLGGCSTKEKIRYKIDGQFQASDELAANQPGVIIYRRSSNFQPANFLTEKAVSFGHSKKYIKQGFQGHHVLNIMFAVFKLPYLLGFRTVNLIGADFSMRPEKQYGFDQGKHDAGINSNNSAYLKINTMADQLEPYFKQAGYKIWNCTPRSCLFSFDSRSLEDAVTDARNHARITTDELDTREWYDYGIGRVKKEKRRRKKR